jgi:methionyl-tRNA formyltransferase
MRILVLADGPVGVSVVRHILTESRDLFVHVLLLPNTNIKSAIQMARSEAKCESSIHEFASYKTLVEKLRTDEGFDLGILAWWPQIIPPDLIRATRLGFVNLHPSLLPFGRGKDPNFWALAEGEPFGVSIHTVDEQIDAGQLLFQEQIPYDWTDTGGTLYEKALDRMTQLFQRNWGKILVSSTYDFPETTVKTPHSRVNRRKDMVDRTTIDLEEFASIRELLNLLRAKTFAGWPGCRFVDSGVQYEISVTITKVETPLYPTNS